MTLQSETSRLLELVVHSLYTRPEIFLRELVSNASDALDRLRFDSLSRAERLDECGPPEIRIEVNPTARTLTVRDNGIGMTRDEVVRHIGTIASSGTSEFQARLNSSDGRSRALDLIGRFGVGFYSCFMVADSVVVVTRQAGEQRGTRWACAGKVEYTVSDAEDAAQGTAVTLHLKPVDLDAGLEDYTDATVVRRIVKRYADFVEYPVVFVSTGAPAVSDAPPADSAVPAAIALNSMRPIWTRPPSDVSEEDYAEWYRHMSGDWNEPILRLSWKAEGRWEYSALLFVPARAPFDLYYYGVTYGLQLYSQRVLIADRCEELLPRYLRFLRGVVDVADLPLNVSRDRLQHAHHLTGIRRWLTKKTVATLALMREQDAQKYLAIWREFGRALKEGISEDGEYRAQLAPILLFESTAHASELTTLAEYVARIRPGQQHIYYLGGESRPSIERSPHLEALRTRGYEILLLTEPVDELVVQALGEYDGRPLQSAAKGEVDLSDGSEPERRSDDTPDAGMLAQLLAELGKHLAPHVHNVRLSKRLTVSPACLADGDLDLPPHIQRLLQRGGGASAHPRRILEVNAQHALVKRLCDRVRTHGADDAFRATADLLLGCAVLAEGSELPDPVVFNARLVELLERRLEAEQSG
jgi:molecular chaperone HtpG